MIINTEAAVQRALALALDVLDEAGAVDEREALTLLRDECSKRLIRMAEYERVYGAVSNIERGGNE